MTLNDLERCNVILRFSPNSTALQADYVTVVENRPTMSVKYCLPVPVFYFWPKLTHATARSLCDSWASCLYSSFATSVWWNKALCVWISWVFNNQFITFFGTNSSGRVSITAQKLYIPLWPWDPFATSRCQTYMHTFYFPVLNNINT